MTKEEFLSSPSLVQDEFIVSGKSFSPPPVIEVPVVSSSGLHMENNQVGCSVFGLAEPNNEVVVGGTERPSSDFLQPDSLSPYTDGFDIRDPVELLFLLDDEIARGDLVLHPWQIQFMLDFAEGGKSQAFPFQAEVQACNGSGKDKIVVAACSVWLCMRFKNARCIITSSSGQQLDNQTEVYIELLCKAANRKFGEVWKTNKRYYECLATGSPMKLFATDEPGKAEGYHPLTKDGKMAIFTSESKTIMDDIFTALERCTGFTHRVDVSTPGLPMGYFYDRCTTGVPRKSIKSVLDVDPTDFILYHITYKDCPHITPNIIQKLKSTLPGGEHGAAYKSAMFAEFGTTDEMVVIPSVYVWKARRSTKEWIREEHNKGGLDLSDGGAETVLCVRNGNKLLKVIPFRFDNTEDTVQFLSEQFTENVLTHKHAYINSDCVGMGKPILDRMWRLGWTNIRYFDSRHAAYEPRTYYRRGDEIWFSVGKLIEQEEIIGIQDELLVRQLSTRYYKLLEGKFKLLSKPEQKTKGYPSPDRADAFVYCFADYKSTFVSYIDKDGYEAPIEKEEEQKVVGAFTMKSKSQNNDYRKAYVINEGQKDFSELEDEITEYNKTRTLVEK